VLDNVGMMKPLQLPRLELSQVEVKNETAQFDLALSMVDTGERLGGKIIYSTDLFDEDTIAEMIERFENLLEQVVATPERPLMDIPLDRVTAFAEAGVPHTLAVAEQSEDQFML
jgi:non-ribosomal peptide synthetase component F